MKKRFAETLKDWRKKHGKMRVELCALLGVPYRTVEDWEAARHTPNAFVQRAVKKQLQDARQDRKRKRAN